jgi:hypothetical protein
MRTLTLVALALALGAGSASARPATAGPIGPLPKHPVTVVRTAPSSLVAVALPKRAGYDWRIAKALNAKVVRQVDEADVGANVVLVFRAVGKGKASILLAQTRGERPKAFRAAEYAITVA